MHVRPRKSLWARGQKRADRQRRFAELFHTHSPFLYRRRTSTATGKSKQTYLQYTLKPLVCERSFKGRRVIYGQSWWDITYKFLLNLWLLITLQYPCLITIYQFSSRCFFFMCRAFLTIFFLIGEWSSLIQRDFDLFLPIILSRINITI